MEDLGLDKVHLKHDQTGKVVLIPQPSDSPNDPYNWPKWKKEMFMLTIRESFFVDPNMSTPLLNLAADISPSNAVYGCGCDGGKFFCQRRRYPLLRQPHSPVDCDPNIWDSKG